MSVPYAQQTLEAVEELPEEIQGHLSSLIETSSDLQRKVDSIQEFLEAISKGELDMSTREKRFQEYMVRRFTRLREKVLPLTVEP